MEKSEQVQRASSTSPAGHPSFKVTLARAQEPDERSPMLPPAAKRAPSTTLTLICGIAVDTPAPWEASLLQILCRRPSVGWREGWMEGWCGP